MEKQIYIFMLIFGNNILKVFKIFRLKMQNLDQFQKLSYQQKQQRRQQMMIKV